MGYVDPNTIHNPATGTVAPASWGDTVRDDLEFLVDRPGCAVYNSATQNVSTSSNTTLTADSELYDLDSMHSTVTNTSRITATTAGKYRIGALVEWDSDATGRREVYLLVNGTTVHTLTIGNAVAGMTQNGTKILTLSAGDYVEVRVWQNSGGTRTPTLRQFSAQHVAR